MVSVRLSDRDWSPEEQEEIREQYPEAYQRAIETDARSRLGGPMPQTTDETMRRWPRVVAHMIAESLGYATPTCAAWIVLDGHKGKSNWCEWVDACYKGNARQVLEHAVKKRKYHKGYMAEYAHAKALVLNYLSTGHQPQFASWF